jgi:hypothetical protein
MNVCTKWMRYTPQSKKFVWIATWETLVRLLSNRLQSHRHLLPKRSREFGQRQLICSLESQIRRQIFDYLRVIIVERVKCEYPRAAKRNEVHAISQGSKHTLKGGDCSLQWGLYAGMRPSFASSFGQDAHVVLAFAEVATRCTPDEILSRGTNGRLGRNGSTIEHKLGMEHVLFMDCNNDVLHVHVRISV